MITLRSLVTTAPFSEEKRRTILDKIDKNELDESQKLQMSELCWNTIFTLYQTEMRLKFDEMMLETAQGTKTYTKNDYQELQAKLIYKLATQLEAGSSEAAIEEVKKQLETYAREQNNIIK